LFLCDGVGTNPPPPLAPAGLWSRPLTAGLTVSCKVSASELGAAQPRMQQGREAQADGELSPSLACRMIDDVEKELKDLKNPPPWLLETREKLAETYSAIISNPSTEMDSTIKALRQAGYKDAYRQRHQKAGVSASSVLTKSATLATPAADVESEVCDPAVPSRPGAFERAAERTWTSRATEMRAASAKGKKKGTSLKGKKTGNGSAKKNRAVCSAKTTKEKTPSIKGSIKKGTDTAKCTVSGNAGLRAREPSSSTNVKNPDPLDDFEADVAGLFSCLDELEGADLEVFWPGSSTEPTPWALAPVLALEDGTEAVADMGDLINLDLPWHI